MRSAVSQSHPQRRFFCAGVSDVPCFFRLMIDPSPTTGSVNVLLSFVILPLLIAVTEEDLDAFEFCEPIVENFL